MAEEELNKPDITDSRSRQDGEDLPSVNPELIRQKHLAAVIKGFSIPEQQDKEVALEDARKVKLFPEVDQAVEYELGVRTKKPRNLKYEQQNDALLEKDPLKELKIAYFDRELEKRWQEYLKEQAVWDERARVIQTDQGSQAERQIVAEPIKPEDLDVFSRLGINKELLFNLTDYINEIKEEPVPELELAKLKLEPKLYFAVPMLARAIAHRRDPNMEVIYPNQEQLKQFKPWLDRVGDFMGRFSEKWSGKFKNFVNGVRENVARSKIDSTTNKITGVVEALGKVENPRKQLVDEIQFLYEDVIDLSMTDQERRLEDQETVPFLTGLGQMFGDEFSIERPDTKPPIEDVMINLFEDINLYSQGMTDESVTRFNSNAHNQKSIWFNSERYPLLVNMIRELKFPEIPDSYSVAAVEMMGGLSKFLIDHGKRPEGVAPKPREDISRWFGETFKADQLERANGELPAVLGVVYDLLPENGPEFVSNVYDIANKVIEAQRQGMDEQQIVSLMFPKATK